MAGVCTSGAQALQEANDLTVGVVLCTYRLPDMMYRELRDCLPAEFQMVAICSRDSGRTMGIPAWSACHSP